MRRFTPLPSACVNRFLPAILLLVFSPLIAHALVDAPGVVFAPEENAFPLVADGRSAPLMVDAADAPGVERAVRDLQADILRVTGVRPDLRSPAADSPRTAVIIGTIGQSTLVDQLTETGKLDIGDMEGRWEAFLHTVVENPLPGIERALVIAGSDRRGTIFGIYTLSEQIGVSPWYWWADAPVPPQDNLFVLPGRRVEAPVVRYRGIFLNDEAPALTNWANEKFGGFNSEFYSRVFELILRLRGNYFWPAMWGSAFNDDDPRNPILAHEYGVVMGTSHHEPLMRAHDEWRRFGEGEWNYVTNPENLRTFWERGLERVKDTDKIITVGMRGDGDEAMSADTNTALLEQIVTDQRTIISEVMDQPAEEVPQIWALYKEVQDYYEAGMRVPDDVTLLWADDNWGNIRRLPLPSEQTRTGGAGVYYHFDYVGGPRSYKWINSTPLTKIWEQMNLAVQYKADRVWIVNVGDLKPMEFPIDFFLTLAWDPDAWPYERIPEFSERWATRIFGQEAASEVAALLNGYTKLNSWRKPEMLAPDTFSLVNYREAERVLAAWHALVERAETLQETVAPESHDAFFQLVLYPVKASAVVHELYIAAGLNRLYTQQGRSEANEQADRARRLFREDGELADQYHRIHDGKWNHMMDQINLGYQIWQQPHIESMPPVAEVRPTPGAHPAMTIEGTEETWPAWGAGQATLPPLDPYRKGSRWIEIFNRGNVPFDISVSSDQPWLTISPYAPSVETTRRIEVQADWAAVPFGKTDARISIEAGTERFSVVVPVVNPQAPRPEDLRGFVETDGHIAIEAVHFSRAVGDDEISWKTLDGFGRTLGGVTMFPVTAKERTPGSASPRLEYDLHLFSSGQWELEFHLAPSLDFQSGEGLRFAFSFDDAEPVILAVDTWESLASWETAVAEGVRKVRAPVEIEDSGAHTLKVWMVTPGVVFERIVIDSRGVRDSYLGPPESPRFGPP